MNANTKAACLPGYEPVTDEAHTFYRNALRALQRAEVPFLVGGAFALECYTGIIRRTKDLDIFVCPADVERTLEVLAREGYRTEVRFPHWIAKAISGEHVIDIIYSSGNGLCTVDRDWFRYAVPSKVLGIAVALIPPEEMIWSKAFVMERERYDGADIAHVLLARSKTLDWSRLLHRFGAHWRVLFSHLILFGFVYPAQRLRIPDWIMKELMRRLQLEMTCLPADPHLCQGTLLSWSQYLMHIRRGEYGDARHEPHGALTEADTALVTETLTREQHRRRPKRTKHERRSSVERS